MAHDRSAPAGYLECFFPNTIPAFGKYIVAQRPAPLAGLVPDCEARAWPVTPWTPDEPNPNLALAPGAEHVIATVFTPHPLFVHYVPPGVVPVQSAAALWAAFRRDFHEAGCLVYPPAATGERAEYQFAILPPNLRYSPDELRPLFPWASLVNFERTRYPVPYGLAYALPAEGPAPAPATPHTVDWPPASLAGFEALSPGLEPGGFFEMLLFFYARQPMPTEQWFRLSLAAASAPDAAISLDEADPCRGIFTAPHWEPGQLILVKSLVPVPGDLPPGDYVLRLDMFDLAVGPDALLPATGDTTLLSLALPVR
jgi:hypothetical protein